MGRTAAPGPARWIKPTPRPASLTATASRSRRCGCRKSRPPLPTPPAGFSTTSPGERVIMIRNVSLSLMCVIFTAAFAAADEPKGPADLIVHNAKVVTVDAKFNVVKAVAVRGGRVLATGDDE